MKGLIVLILSFWSWGVFAQDTLSSDDSLRMYEGKVVPVYTDEYMRLYNRMKRMVVKVYPYALYAADLIDKIDENAENIEKRRKKNKFYRESYKGLKDKFKYFILELYTSEGEMLMKLIHRETGMTVYDISNKYRGRQKAEMFNLMAKIWDQDLHIKYDPTQGNDKITEHVIQDIQSGIVAFDDEIVTIDKITYRENKKEDKRIKKLNKKRNRAYKKKKRKRERERRRKERKAEKSKQ